MEKVLDLRPNEEESCSSSVIKFYNEWIACNSESVWLTLLLKDMHLYYDGKQNSSRYFARITLLIDEYFESGIHSTLVRVVQ